MDETRSIAECLAALKPDKWRAKTGFSSEVDQANRELWSSSEAESVQILNEWLRRFQPCLFGRMAAQKGLLRYCILSADTLRNSDEAIQDRIQSARLDWRRAAADGESSGFVILAVCPELARAVPDRGVAECARRLASLYLLEDVEHDEIYLEDVELEIPGRHPQVRHWKAGVNYFSAHGDKRWWQDHRIPGGIGLSINSVGHMAKSGLLANALREFEELLAVEVGAESPTRIASLKDALEFAMRTIEKASIGPSGKATELLPLPETALRCVPTCPITLPSPLNAKNYCEYLGHYHTDYTLPSEYFESDVERRPSLPSHLLDFTYLFLRNRSNPAHETMGLGIQIRDDQRVIRAEPRGIDRGEGILLKGEAAEEVLERLRR